MKSAALLILPLLVAGGCAGSKSSPPPTSSDPRLLANQPPPRAEPPPPTPAPAPAPDMAERTTTDAALTYTVRYPRRALLGRPIPVTVTIANHSRQTAYIAPGSQSVRAVSPALWFNHTGKTPYTPLGERHLRDREETGTFRAPIPPARPGPTPST